jgi:hypothetical protein
LEATELERGRLYLTLNFERERLEKVATLTKMRESHATDVSARGNTAQAKAHPQYLTLPNGGAKALPPRDTIAFIINAPAIRPSKS